MGTESGVRGLRGILAPANRLDLWILLVLLVLLATSAARYADRHGPETGAPLVLIGAFALAAAALCRTFLPDRTWWQTAWVLLTALLWVALTVAAPSFAWCGVPVAFAVMRVLPFSGAVTVIAMMSLSVGASWTRATGDLDPTLIVGPIGIAVVTVLSYRALDRESRTRQELLDRLRDAQDELAELVRRRGILAERTRISREIHDSVGQHLSSINLLLLAAQQDWDTSPGLARRHVGTAAAAAREGLDEVRSIVHDLAPDAAGSGALPAALRDAAAIQTPELDASVSVHGNEVSLPPEISVALLRTARGALANVREHAHATRVGITLTFNRDEVLLDVRDDGQGLLRLDSAARTRGHGLRGIRDRAEALGGRFSVESAPGEGTTVSVSFPVEES